MPVNTLEVKGDPDADEDSALVRAMFAVEIPPSELRFRELWAPMPIVPVIIEPMPLGGVVGGTIGQDLLAELKTDAPLLAEHSIVADKVMLDPVVEEVLEERVDFVEGIMGPGVSRRRRGDQGRRVYPLPALALRRPSMIG